MIDKNETILIIIQELKDDPENLEYAWRTKRQLQELNYKVYSPVAENIPFLRRLNKICPRCNFEELQFSEDNEGYNVGFCKRCKLHLTPKEIELIRSTSLHIEDSISFLIYSLCLDQRKIIHKHICPICNKVNLYWVLGSRADELHCKCGWTGLERHCKLKKTYQKKVIFVFPQKVLNRIKTTNFAPNDIRFEMPLEGYVLRSDVSKEYDSYVHIADKFYIKMLSLEDLLIEQEVEVL